MRHDGQMGQGVETALVLQETSVASLTRDRLATSHTELQDTKITAKR